MREGRHMAHCVTHGPPPSIMASSCVFLSSYLFLLFFLCLFLSLFVPYILFTFLSVLSSTRFVSFSLSPPLFLFESFWLVFSPRFWGPSLQVLPSLCSYTPMCKFTFSFSFYPCRSSSLLPCFFWPHSFMVPSLIFLLPLFSILFLLSFSLIIILVISTYLMFLFSYHVILPQ